MMAFITPFSPNFRVFLAVLLLAFASVARAESGIQVKMAELNLVDEVYQLKADFEVNFSQAVEDALNKGVPLNFTLHF